ncbi:thioredoxin family protein [Pseudomonas protegens]|uniref:thioredoxin family protein n=1 Tax=Pseudomonas protegens TaxID=380021 RepID=UPI00227FC0C2|nr:thioredoxin family protein [Pseudomonas protegens]MCY7261898.1 thioredoxin family protein [Pseudomonas protegens]
MSQISIQDSEDFDSRLANAGEKLVVVNFYAPWCTPCKMIAPLIEALTLIHTNVIFLKVDVDEVEEVALRYDISHIPTYIYIKNGEVVQEVYGANIVAFTLALETNQ